MPAMDDLTAFLRARLDEAAATAWAVHDVTKCDALLYEEDMADAAARTPDCDCGYPARVLREVEAGREILTAYIKAGACGYRGEGWITLRFAVETLAAVWSGHPDYRQEWA